MTRVRVALNRLEQSATHETYARSWILSNRQVRNSNAGSPILCFFHPMVSGGPRWDEVSSEAAAPAPAFVHEVRDRWAQDGVRVVVLRAGLVLWVEGGMLARLLTPFEFDGGGTMGNGRL